MALSPEQLLKWGTPWAITINLNTAGYTVGSAASGVTVVTPQASSISTNNIGGQRFAVVYGLVLTNIHLFELANAAPATVDITEWDGTTNFPIFRTGNQVTYTTNVSYDLWHPLRPGIQSGASVTNGNTIRISTSAAFGASARLRLEGFHTSDNSLWNQYVSVRALAANNNHITFP